MNTFVSSVAFFYCPLNPTVVLVSGDITPWSPSRSSSGGHTRAQLSSLRCGWANMFCRSQGGERTDPVTATAGRTCEQSSMKIKSAKAVFMEQQVSGDELDPLCQQQDSPVGRELLPIPALHKLFLCVLSFILADYSETAVKLGWCPASPSHCWPLFYKGLHLGEATSV